MEIKKNRNLRKRKFEAMLQNLQIGAGASNGLKGAKFTANSLLFTVPEVATKSRDLRKPLWELGLSKIIRRSPVPISENSLLNSLLRLMAGRVAHPIVGGFPQCSGAG